MVRAGGGFRSKATRSSPELSLICSMLVQAIREMRAEPNGAMHYANGERRVGNTVKVRATTWLASKDARRWFDLASVDQRFALEGMDWRAEAQGLLDAQKEFKVTPAEAAMMAVTVDALS